MTATRVTPAQARVLDYLYRCGWASPRAIADHLYGNRRQSARARALVDKLADLGLAEPKFRTAFTLTDAGRTLARDRTAQSTSTVG